jgi:hypothetical protein
MSILLFLLVPLVVIIVSSAAPQGMRSSIEGFQQQMKALSPEDDVEPKT